MMFSDLGARDRSARRQTRAPLRHLDQDPDPSFRTSRRSTRPACRAMKRYRGRRSPRLRRHAAGARQAQPEITACWLRPTSKSRPEIRFLPLQNAASTSQTVREIGNRALARSCKTPASRRRNDAASTWHRSREPGGQHDGSVGWLLMAFACWARSARCGCAGLSGPQRDDLVRSRPARHRHDRARDRAAARAAARQVVRDREPPRRRHRDRRGAAAKAAAARRLPLMQANPAPMVNRYRSKLFEDTESRTCAAGLLHQRVAVGPRLWRRPPRDRVPAPGRFSITNDLPSRCSSRWARSRARSLSVPPPAANGTRIVTLRAGYPAQPHRAARRPAVRTPSQPSEHNLHACSSLVHAIDASRSRIIGDAAMPASCRPCPNARFPNSRTV